ncbi:MAG: Ig-like domain-containing protein [Spirochaetia bacterium]|nr:Ig-like domain-containing protein [Spirochaetia bacterium]
MLKKLLYTYVILFGFAVHTLQCGSEFEAFLIENTLKSNDSTDITPPDVNNDTTAPVLSSAVLETSTTIRLTFSESLEQLTAETAVNYQIDTNSAGSLILSAVRDSVNLSEVLITLTGSLTEGTHNITVYNVEDASANVITNDGVDNLASFFVPDTTAPVLSSAALETSTTIRLTFSEDVEQTTAETTTNYQIDANAAGVGILSAVRDAVNLNEVLITLPAPLTGGTHNITVYNVEDTFANVITNDGIDNTTSFMVVPDTTPPILSSVLLEASTTIRLTFSETVEQLTAETAVNYQIDANPAGSLISSVVRDAVNLNEVLITLSGSLTEGAHNITVYNIEDASANVITNNGVDNLAFFIVPDTTPPVLSSAVLETSTTIRLTFLEDVEQTTAETTTNYQIDANPAGSLISWAVRDAVNLNEVLITLSGSLTEGAHNITVYNVEDASANIIINDGVDNLAFFIVPDTTPPVLSSAILETSTTIRLTFSEDVEQTTAETTTNYQIDANPAGSLISSAVRDAVNLNEVLITLSGSLTEGSHNVTVYNVEDASANVITHNGVDNLASYIVADITPPVLLGVTVQTDLIIILTFSESLDTFTAETAANYQIDAKAPGADINNVALDVNNVDVIITFNTSKRLTQGAHSVTVLNVEDLSANIINNNGADNVSSFWVDTRAPLFDRAVVLGPNSLRLIFSEDVDQISAENINNYEIDTNGAAANIASAMRDTVPTDVIITTTSPITDGTHTMTVYNIADLFNNTIANDSISNVQSFYIDSAPPSLNSISVINPSTIRLFFSEQIELTSAQTIANYQIDLNSAGAGISSVVLDAGGTDVILTTTAPLTEALHSVTVFNIVDLYSNAIIEDDINNKASFTMNYPPVLISAVSESATTIRLTFSEDVEQISAETISNYHVSSCHVLLAVRDAVASEVIITIHDIIPDGTHTLTVFNVKDLNAMTINADGVDNVQSFFVENKTPSLLSISVESTDRIRLNFSEPMNQTSVENTLNFEIDANGPGNLIASALLSGTNGVLLYFTSFLPDASYTLTVTGVLDLNLNAIVENGIDNTGLFTIATSGTFDEGAVHADPFGDSVSDFKLFTYDDRVYAGPNDAQSQVFRFAHDLSGTANTDLDGDLVTAGNQSFYDLPNASGSLLKGIDFFLPACLGAQPHNLTGAACSTAGGTQALFVSGYIEPSKANYESIWQTNDGGGNTTGFRMGFEELSGFLSGGASPMMASALVYKDQLYVCNIDAGGQSVLFSRMCVNPSGCANGDVYHAAPVYLNGRILDHIGTNGNPSNLQNGNLMGIDTMHDYDNDGPGGNDSQLYIASGGSDTDIDTRTLLSQVNDGGVLRTQLTYSTAANPPSDGNHFEDITPSSIKWLRYMSIAMPENYGNDGICDGNGDDWDCLEPANTYTYALKAIPNMKTAPNGDLYLIRNACASETIQRITSTVKQTCPSGSEVPQLWMLPKGSTASPKGSPDWVLVAENPSANGRVDMSGNTACGTTNMCDTENTHISLLEVNGNYLYIGLENSAYGLNIWRADMSSVPSGVSPLESQFSLVSSFGLGDTANNTRIFSYTTYESGGLNYLFVSAGNGTGITKIFRTID